METITVGRAVRLINSRRGALLLAVMGPEEYGADHIPGSYRLEPCEGDEQCQRVVRALREAGERVILYSGRSGPEAFQAAEWLEEADVAPVLVLTGGFDRWRGSGYATARDLGRDQLAMSQEEQDRELLATLGEEAFVP